MTQADAEMRVIAARLSEQYPANKRELSCACAFLSRSASLAASRTRDATDSFRCRRICVIHCFGQRQQLAAHPRRDALKRDSHSCRARRVQMARHLAKLMTESIVLSVIGGALGLLLAFWGVDAIIALVPKDLYFPC
ncbi:MAG: hypothetical protein WKF84_09155 [Pyrinomonadaceae bacterium]